ncbi:hypothetical protein DID77_04620 [Candidatus Marinamargulisbacteria bacterium SCGC AG-439-L15]|nr:hypothetical protein DID77_04620 [Candidatus Marinamargulisbacteria bacterium SCGC AG-439-L15]
MDNVLFGLTLIVFLGITAQWLAWRVNLPSIIILLLFGLLAGPVTGILSPANLFGDLLFPIVSLLVAVIVFEGGLSLKIADLKGFGKLLWNLIVGGTLLSFGIIAYASYAILGLPIKLAILFGAMMVITGPTVIVPMLRHVKLSRSFGSLMRWEGILIAPIGTIFNCACL